MKSLAGVEGKYRCRVITAAGKIKQDTGWFTNLILDQGLDFPGKFDNYLGYCHAGTGNAVVTVLDSALETFLVSTALVSTQNFARSSVPYYGSKIFHYEFGIGVIGANTITEIGTGRQAGTGELFSRIVLPVSIVVLATETVHIDYELRIYPDHLTLAFDTIIINSISYDIDILACNIDDPNYWGINLGDKFGGNSVTLWRTWDSTAALGTVLSIPSGVELIGGATSALSGTYSDGSSQLVVNALWGLTKANDPGGIGALIVAADAGAYQLLFDPPLPKTALTELRLNWLQTWARRILP